LRYGIITASNPSSTSEMLGKTVKKHAFSKVETTSFTTTAGTVYCCCPQELKLREMSYGGFERDRQTLKYRCPAKEFGRECKGKDSCPVKGSIRVPPFRRASHLYPPGSVKLQLGGRSTRSVQRWSGLTAGLMFRLGLSVILSKGSKRCISTVP
jgi:hypothetical protein